MKKGLSLLLVFSFVLTLFTGITVSASENYVSAYEDFAATFTITSVNTDGKGAVETTIIPPSGSALAYSATGTIQKNRAETDEIYNWITQNPIWVTLI